MTDNSQGLPTQPGDLGSRKRSSRVTLLSLAVSSIALSFFAIREAQHDCPFVTWDDVQGCIEMPIVPDSPGVQLVGHVTKTRRYSMFHFGAPSVCVTAATVIYEDHHYFFVATVSDWRNTSCAVG
jgi:hypothetical protein